MASFVAGWGGDSIGRERRRTVGGIGERGHQAMVLVVFVVVVLPFPPEEGGGGV